MAESTRLGQELTRTVNMAHDLEAAHRRITELEEALTMAGEACEFVADFANSVGPHVLRKKCRKVFFHPIVQQMMKAKKP